MEQMYTVVSEVQHYKEFVPWCKESTRFGERPGHCKCILEVGFHPLSERYTSHVTLAKPNLVRVRISFLKKFIFIFVLISRYISSVKVCHSSAFQTISVRSVNIKIIKHSGRILANLNNTMQTKQKTTNIQIETKI